jgi:hypothetical protein
MLSELPNAIDPFAALYSAGPQSQIYISGRLQLLRMPSGVAGEWFSINDTWYRRLTPAVFLWLRDAVNRAIESGRLSGEFQGAAETLRQIAAIGIEHVAFQPEEIADGCTPPDCFNFSDGLPRWAEEFAY